MKVMVLIPPSKFSKNVARDLVYGCWCKGKRIGGIKFPPISQVLVASVLRDAGHEAHLVDAASAQMSVGDLQSAIAQGYGAVIILTSTMTVNEDAEILRELKSANARLATIVYGAHPTFLPLYTLQRQGIDIIVRREAEFILRDLIAALERGGSSWKQVRGIGYKENGQAVANEYYPFIENLDDLPIPDRTMLPADVDYFNPIVKRMPYTTMFTSRGCPGKCTFCTSPPFYGRTIRYRSTESVLAEMEVVREMGCREVFFRDEMFTLPRKRLQAICRGIIERGLDLNWICSSRIGAVDKETITLMREAGCHMIRFGVESGVQEILDKVRKGITIEQSRKTFAWTHQIGMDTHAHMMIGMPGETQETIDRTIEFVKEIDPTVVTFGICTPYPGTQLFEQVLEVYPEIGDGSDHDLSKLHTAGYYNHVFTGLTDEELAANMRRIYREFYMRPSYVLKWLRRIDSVDEFKRVTLAAAQVVDFVLRGDDAQAQGGG